MSDRPVMKAAGEVRPGDRVRLPTGTEMTVTRIAQRFFGRPDMLALIEDSDVRWLSRPLKLTAEVEVLTG